MNLNYTGKDIKLIREKTKLLPQRFLSDLYKITGERFSTYELFLLEKRRKPISENISQIFYTYAHQKTYENITNTLKHIRKYKNI